MYHPGVAAPSIAPEHGLLRRQVCFFPKAAALRMEGRMKAIVYGQYGPPEVLELKDMASRFPAMMKSWCGSARPPSTPWTGTSCEARLILRLMTGLRKPKVPRLGVDTAGRVEAQAAT